jgi:UDP-glucuronate 4-epimerase
MSQDQILITGAAGFIGSHLTDRLLATGFNVVAVDNLCDFYDPQIKKQNLAGAWKHPHFQWVEADIRDKQAIEQLFEQYQPKNIVHLAAMAGVRPSMANPSLYAQVNVEATGNLLEAAAKQSRPVEHFVFASSSSVYGQENPRPFREDMPIDRPFSPYAATKVAGEMLCKAYYLARDLPITCLRLFTVYGPRQRPDLAISQFLRKVGTDQTIEMFGDGSSSRDYTYVNDIVDGLVAAIERPDGFSVYNLGGDRAVLLGDLIQIIENVTGHKANINTKPMQAGDVSHTWADLTLSQQKLGYAPKVTLEEGITEQWNWIQENVIL